MNVCERLNHTKWECKYHVVLSPKYRRKVLVGKLRPHFGENVLGIGAIEGMRDRGGHLMVAHVHMPMSVPPKYAVSQVVGYLTGKSAIHIAQTYGGKRRNFVREHFWEWGYWVFTVGRDEAAVGLYIQRQEREDQRLVQLGLFGGESRLERLQY